MSYNLGTIIGKVQNKLDDSGFSSTMLTDFANDTQRELFNSKFFKFMEAATTLAVTAGTESIGTLPTDMQLVRDLRITVPAALGGILQPMAVEVFDTMLSSNITGVQGAPTQWYMYDDTINLYPIPSTDITVAMRYWKVPTELTTSTDVPEIPAEFQEILVLGMYKRALEYNDSFDQSAFITVQMEKLIDDMSRRYTPQTSQPTVMRTNVRRAW